MRNAWALFFVLLCDSSQAYRLSWVDDSEVDPKTFFDSIGKKSDSQLQVLLRQYPELMDEMFSIIQSSNPEAFKKLDQARIREKALQGEAILEDFQKAGFQPESKFRMESGKEISLQTVLFVIQNSGSGMQFAKSEVKNRADATQHADFYKKVLACNGTGGAPINLDSQFLPTVDQANRGTCFAVSTTAAFEAALHRQGIQNVKALSPEFAIVLSRSKFHNHWVNQIRSLQSIQTAGDTADSLNEEDGIYKGGLTTLVADALIDESTAPLHNPAVANKYKSLVASHRVDPNRNFSTPDPYEELFRLVDQTTIMADGLSAVRKIRALQGSIKTAEEQFLQSVRRSNQQPKQSIQGFGRADLWKDRGYLKTRFGKCSESQRLSQVESVMSALCAGLPVLFSYKTQGTYSANKTSIDYNEMNGNHAAVITGVQVINGIPMFVARGSYGKGDEKIPQASYELIPFAKMCNAMNASVIYHPGEASKVQKLFPISFPPPARGTKSAH